MIKTMTTTSSLRHKEREEVFWGEATIGALAGILKEWDETVPTGGKWQAKWRATNWRTGHIKSVQQIFVKNKIISNERNERIFEHARLI
jgi:hypothetical protein